LSGTLVAQAYTSSAALLVALFVALVVLASAHTNAVKLDWRVGYSHRRPKETTGLACIHCGTSS